MRTSEVERAFGLLEGHALHRVGVYHGGPNISMPKKLLDRPNVIVRLEQVTGEAVAIMPSSA